MKKTALLTGLCLVLLSAVQAQGIKDKLNSAKTQLTGGSTGSETAAEINQTLMDQFGEFKKFSGDKVYTITQRTNNTFYHDKWNGEFLPMDKVLSDVVAEDKKAGFTYNGMSFMPHSDHSPLYFTNKGQNDQLVFINGTMYHVSGLKEDGTFYKLTTILTIDKSNPKSCAKWEADHAKNAVKAYFEAAKPMHDAAMKNAEADKNKAAAEKRAKYTITDKNVTGIKIVLTDKMKQGEVYGITVIATLKDGSTISTKEGGFMDEYEVSVSGLPATFKDPSSITGTRSTAGESTISIPDVMPVSGDQITVTVKAKHNPALTAKATAVMDYSGNIDLNYNAEMRSDRISIEGGDLRLEIKQVKHKVTGENLLEYKVFNGKGDLLKHFRINSDATVNASVNGQKGWKAISSSKPPMNGTRGGNVKIIIDPSVANYNLNVSNRGGRGGDGGYGYPAGRDGADGKVETVNQKVSW